MFSEEEFFAVTAALEVQMLICLSVTLATTVLKLKTLKFLDFRLWTLRLLRNFRLYGLPNLLVYKSHPPGLRDLLMYVVR